MLFLFALVRYNRRMILTTLTSLLVITIILSIVYYVLEHLPEPFNKIGQIIVIAIFIIYILRFFGI